MNAKSIKKSSRNRTNVPKLRRKKDKSINYKNSPATTKEFWERAEVFMPKQKIPISLRLDKDVLDYFKEEGSGYQSRINAVLKAYMITHPHHK